MRIADDGSVGPPGATCSPQKSPLQHMRQELLSKGAAPRKAIPVVQASDTTPEQFYEKYIVPCTPVVLEGAMQGKRPRKLKSFRLSRPSSGAALSLTLLSL